MDELISLVDQHKFWRNGFRVNLDKDENHRRVDKNGRTWLKYPYAPRSNTIREGAILECVQKMLPHVNSVCLNKKAATSPPMQRHKDRKNRGILSSVSGAITRGVGSYAWRTAGYLTKSINGMNMMAARSSTGYSRMNPALDSLPWRLKARRHRRRVHPGGKRCTRR